MAKARRGQPETETERKKERERERQRRRFGKFVAHVISGTPRRQPEGEHHVDLVVRGAVEDLNSRGEIAEHVRRGEPTGPPRIRILQPPPPDKAGVDPDEP